MKKIINPCKCKVSSEMEKQNAFCKIEYEDGRLSISGVIAPLKNGNCLGSAGQCVDEIKEGTPTTEWTTEMLQKFCDIWDNWHLNDMRPYCKHQEELGWKELAAKEIKIYHCILKDEISKKKKDAEKTAIKYLKMGISFTPTKEQTYYSNLENFIDVYEDANNIPSEYEVFKNSIRDSIETKTLGWIDTKKYSEGLLGKECPICGYKYGTSWIKEEVPEDIIKWLFELPETKIKPAWV